MRKGYYKRGDLVQAPNSFLARTAAGCFAGIHSHNIEAATIGIVRGPVHGEPGLYEVEFELGANQTVSVEAENYQLQPLT